MDGITVEVHVLDDSIRNTSFQHIRQQVQ